jgi:hypothetical protein
MARLTTEKLSEEGTTLATAALTRETNGAMSDRDTLFMLSGIALMVFGAGLILSNPLAQKYINKIGIGGLAQGALPDLERYLKLRAM